jgi:hypothetical protein
LTGVASAEDLSDFQRRLVQEAVAFGFAERQEVKFRRLATEEPVLLCQVGDCLSYLYTDAFQFEAGGRVDRLEAEDVPTEEEAAQAFLEMLSRAFRM